MPECGKLRILICRECGLSFAAPMGFVSARVAAGQAIGCPAGHPSGIGRDEQGDTYAINKGLAEANADLTEKLHAAERELMTLRAQTQAAELSEKELDRRCRLIAARAHPAPVNRKICMFCAKPLRALAGHLLNQHKEEIARLSPADFQ